MLKKVLAKLAKELNENDILWGVGASVLLNKYGIVDYPADIDIIVDEKDVLKVDELLSSLGNKQESEISSNYSTDYFFEYDIDGIEVDVMSNFIVNYNESKYTYAFDEHSITSHMEVEGVDVPYLGLEDWFIVYSLMEGRERKATKIKEHLLKCGSENVFLLDRAMEERLPESLESELKYMLLKLKNMKPR